MNLNPLKGVIKRTDAGRALHAQNMTRQPIIPAVTVGLNAANVGQAPQAPAIKNSMARQPH